MTERDLAKAFPVLARLGLPLMVHAEDRPAAVDRLRRALDETAIGGVQTDAGFLRWLVDHPEVRAGDSAASDYADPQRRAPRAAA